jgi:tetratricopeptide (TPR) repeat protein
MNMRREKNVPAAIAGLLLLLGCLALAGCAAPSPSRTATRPPARPEAPPAGPVQTLPPQDAAAPAAPSVPGSRPPAERDPDPRPVQTPRAVASLHLTEQAQRLLERGNPDEAIRTLERAVNLNPSRGENYYYLAEAWLLKNNLPQARMFNRLAAQHLPKEAAWRTRVAEQAERIERARGRQP